MSSEREPIEGVGRGVHGNLLDPSAQEFYPMALAGPQIYFPYPPPLPPAAPAIEVYATSPAAPPPARSVVLSMVPRQVREEAVRAAMKHFGGVRAVEMGALAREGVVTVHFFDLRSAEAAVMAVREQHRLGNWGSWDAGIGGGGGMLVMHPYQQRQQIGGVGLVAGHAVWAQFAEREMDDQNQGSIIAFNWDRAASLAALVEFFQAFGDVKEVRETPLKPHKFVEFFDVRDAARAVTELNGKGRRMVVEFSRPGGQARSFYNRFSPLPPRLTRTTLETQPSSSSSSSSIQQASPEPVLMRRGETTTRNRNKGSSKASSSKQQQSSSSRKALKNHGKKDGEAVFLFKEGGAAMVDSGSTSRDSRTTVMIKNIPNKYSQKLLLNMLDNHCINCNEKIAETSDEPLSAYDFLYLPIDFNNKCNVGYGFVNLTSPEAALRLHKAFHMQPWEVFNSRKICQVTYARLQGLEALKEHFRNSKFACDEDEYMPVVFSPARDGRLQLTTPVPIGGRIGLTERAMDLHLSRSGDDMSATMTGASSTTTSTQAPSDLADGGDDEEGFDDEVSNALLGGSDGTGCDLSEAFIRLSYAQG